MRYGISWHQLVEWQQSYAVNPFGEERADLRAAINGATVANEIRAIAAGLSGSKTVKAIEVKDLMIDTSKGGSGSGRESGIDRKGRESKRKVSSDNDRAAAESYYRSWSRSIQAKLNDANKTVSKPKRASRSRSSR